MPSQAAQEKARAHISAAQPATLRVTTETLSTAKTKGDTALHYCIFMCLKAPHM